MAKQITVWGRIVATFHNDSLPVGQKQWTEDLGYTKFNITDYDNLPAGYKVGFSVMSARLRNYAYNIATKFCLAGTTLEDVTITYDSNLLEAADGEPYPTN